MKTILFCLTFVLITIISCQKQIAVKEKVILNLNTSINTFESNSNLGSINHDYSLTSIFDTTILLSNNLALKAEIKPKKSNKTIHSINTTNQNKKIAATTTLSTNVYYKLIIYNSNGSFKTERTYQIGNESSQSPILLDGGVTYTFIAYSLNTTNLNDLNQLGTSFSTQTLSNSAITVSNDSDLLFFKTTQQISGNADDYLNIVFQHKFNKIDIEINSSSTGYNITAVAANLVTPQKDAKLSFSDGNITRTTGGGKSSALVFPSANLGGNNVVSNPILVNAASNIQLLEITNLTIGPLTQGSTSTPFKPFSSVTLVPGYSYTLDLTVTHQEEFLTHKGQSAVRLNGMIWMRHNLRMDGNYSADPDLLAAGTHGDFFQWGRSNKILTGGQSPSTLVVGDWSTGSITDANAWNAGIGDIIAREDNPIKSANDPCPADYRIPTNKELSSLILNTVATSVGTGTKNDSNHTYGLILTSKRKSTVKMTIPTQGSLFASVPPDNYSAYFNEFAIRTRIWSSYYTNSNNTIAQIVTAHLDATNATNPIAPSVNIRGPQYSNSGTLSLPIRCIAI